ncbi:phosphopantothenoylcysteine decarboxylase/phosphopantothenate/cysteine ligase [Halogeometricum pallidum JCM 14848]|uniref:Coenzyme A biosynthesis bifunctional protein CoaBC n=1 Tax=Halogeometricum pallidum JCM 14848 TaxID=1227487 RepID=M0CU06_HALPD|nr:bifunctional phosphopantothenoylcysteine decarboxylase/phosphopantothenate--cysteine ligase CoaBC [Halogeometricum pallidum]ELZ26735.1 phosphopantothenoylcysteine decarboxylase/phosphopantothenate/cysteine ligase [Halogeometricum pallidum JCM 14848]
MLEGVNVVLGVSGSIAAVKVVELAHELRRRGASVRGVMTESARGIVHPWAVEFATGNDVVTEITGRVEHVELCGRDGWADVLLLAPATANTVGKIASAVDDTPVTTCATTALGAGVPVVVAPAMHEPMYDHPGVLDAIDRIESWGVRFVDPRVEEGKAKIATEEAIVTDVARATAEQTLAGKRVVVTAGATAEPVDPVRVLTNRASGKTGREVARACYVRGADVTLVQNGADAPYAETVRVETGAEMLEGVRDSVADADALVSAAAISDYTVEAAAEKLRSGEPRTLDLEPTPKLIDSVREARPDLPVVGFKAETSGDDEAMVAAARRILDRAGLAFVVANDAAVMGEEATRALFVRADDVAVFSGSKADLGARVADELAAELA